MTEQPKLLKPRWTKIQNLEKQRSGYNVLVKVIKTQRETIQTATGLKIPIVRAVVADETGSSNAFFKGDKNTEHIVEGKVIAIRNGVKKFIKGHISLEIDDFGLVTLEKNTIEPSKELNISQKEHQFKPRNERNNFRGRQKSGYTRNQSQRGGDRRDFTQNRNNNQNRRDNQNNRRFNNSERRRDNQKGRDQDFDRRPRRNQPSRNQQDKPRRNQQFRNQQDRPRRRQEDRDRKPRIKFSKIQAIEPGDENITFVAKVLSVENVGKMKRCLLGDETAVVKAFLPNNEHLEKNNSVIIFDAESKVVKEHIEIQVLNERKIDKARKPIEGTINEEMNISDKSWVETD